MLRRSENYRKSLIYRLPPEIIIAVASHLGDQDSLFCATQISYLWRSALVSYPYLWSSPPFWNENQTLEFLERSKSAPFSVDLMRCYHLSEVVKEKLKRSTHMFSALRAVDSPFLYQLLIRPLPTLRSLEITTPRQHPFLTSPTIYPSFPPPRAPNLTVFSFTLKLFPSYVKLPRMEGLLLDTLRGCPLLEVVSFCYDHSSLDVEPMTHETSTKAVSLPLLRSFTHKTTSDTACIGIFNQLSLPPTCDITFAVKDATLNIQRLDRNFTPLLDSPYLYDVKVVTMTFYPVKNGPMTIKITLVNSKNMKISFTRFEERSSDDHSLSVVKRFLEFLRSSEIFCSVEALHFRRFRTLFPVDDPFSDLTEALLKLRNLKTVEFWQCETAFFPANVPPAAAWCPSVENLEICLPKQYPWEATTSTVLEQVRDIAARRKEHGIPFKTLTLTSQAEKLLEKYGGLMEELRSCVQELKWQWRFPQAFEGDCWTGGIDSVFEPDSIF